MKPAMTKAVGEVVDAEVALAREFLRVSDRHVADAEIHHLSRRLAAQCQHHLDVLASVAGTNHESPSPPELLSASRRTLAAVSARSAKAAMLLLADLRRLYLKAQACDLAWTMLEQGAKATRDRTLGEIVYLCGLETSAQCHWIKTRIKEASPQVLAAG